MFRKFNFVGLLAALLLFTGCTSKGMIHVASIEGGLVKVLDRHDTYVQNDQGLSDAQRSTYLRTSQLLRKVMEEAKGNGVASRRGSVLQAHNELRVRSALNQGRYIYRTPSVVTVPLR